jgi:predicted permease
MSNVASGTTASPRGRRTLWALVGAEFALATALVVAGGLLAQAFDKVRGVEPGFRTDGVLLFSLSLPETAYPEGKSRLAFWESALERLQALPRVESAGVVTCPPLGCHWGSFFEPEGRPPLAPGAPDPVVLYRYASPRYFETLGLRLRAGRFFTASDGRGERERHRAAEGDVVIVNETYVRTFWPGVEDPVGKRLRFRSRDGDEPWMTVVGLVGDVKHYGLEQPMRPGIYLPLAQRAPGGMTVALRTRVDPASVAGAARTVVRELDPDLALFQVRTMEAALRESLRTRAVYSWLLGTFALLAVALALGGAYGVTSYLVTQRTREIGIRLALGAQGRDIVGTVLRASLAVVAGGIVVGALVSIAGARLMSGLLFGGRPYDPLVLGGAVALLLATALLANGVPAWRAAKLEPMSTLRSE